jgi:hypothetical protein
MYSLQQLLSSAFRVLPAAVEGTGSQLQGQMRVAQLLGFAFAQGVV